MNQKAGEMSYGFASNLRDTLPNASFIGFTGTPIEKTDANTRAVFGDFYDALATNENAMQAMCDAKLKVIAAELISEVKKSVTIDWTLRESAQAKIRVMIILSVPTPSDLGYTSRF